MTYQTYQDGYRKGCRVVEWINGNKARFNSLHKGYNSKIQCPSPGNTIDDGYLGLFVRAWNELECNGRINEPGKLYNFDMESFRRYGVPHRIEELLKQSGGILYCLRTYTGDRLTIYGWVVTDKDHNYLTSIHTGANYKQDSVVDEFIPYVAVQGTF